MPNLRTPYSNVYGSCPEGARQIIVAAGMIAYHQAKARLLSPYEDAVEVLRILKDRRLGLGIISSGVGIKQSEKIVRLGVHQIVEARHIHITDAVGIAKTNPKIYRRACQAMDVNPHEAAYVGDNPAMDVDIPRRVGMRTFWSRRGGKYADVRPAQPADHTVHNFWDLLEIIDQQYNING